MGRVIGVIPARWGSSRFPGKPMAPICGIPMIHWTITGAKQSQRLDRLIVATDDNRIADYVYSTARVKKHLTPIVHFNPLIQFHSGSDRVAEAVRQFELDDHDIVVNIQGDEPLITGEVIDAAINALDYQEADIGTVVSNDPSSAGVRVILDRYNHGIWFGREGLVTPWRHVGVYAFRYEALQEFALCDPIENTRGSTGAPLEEMRMLWLMLLIKVKVLPYAGMSVDTPADIKRVEDALGKN